jgi:hypothetical protein
MKFDDENRSLNEEIISNNIFANEMSISIQNYKII